MHWTKSTIIANIRWNENFKWFFLPPHVPPTIQARKQCWKVAWNHFFLHKSLSQCPPTTQPLLQYCSILVFRFLTFPHMFQFLQRAMQCSYKSVTLFQCQRSKATYCSLIKCWDSTFLLLLNLSKVIIASPIGLSFLIATKLVKSDNCFPLETRVFCCLFAGC